MAEEFKWEWVPHVSVGGIAFDQPLPGSIPGLELVRDEELDDPDAAYGVVGGETSIFVADGVVETVHCEDNFFFKGRSLGASGRKTSSAV